VILLLAAVLVYVFLLVLLGRAAVRGVRAGLDDASVRWGELLGPAEPGRPKADAETLHASNVSELERTLRHRFRQLAARREARP